MLSLIKISVSLNLGQVALVLGFQRYRVGVVLEDTTGYWRVRLAGRTAAALGNYGRTRIGTMSNAHLVSDTGGPATKKRCLDMGIVDRVYSVIRVFLCSLDVSLKSVMPGAVLVLSIPD